MKRPKYIALLIIYIVVFLFTIAMEYLSIYNLGTMVLVNGGTLIMATFGGVLFWLLLRADKDKAKEQELETEREESIPDKQKYIEFANEKGFTKRELEIGWLLVNGYSNMQIAETLYIAETTVKKHVSHIYEKAEISGRKEFKKILN